MTRLSVPAPKARVVLVTGATSGIGAATARLLVAGGAQVGLLARDPALVSTSAARLGADAIGVAADVLDVSSLEQAIAHVRERFGRIDGVVHAAQVMAYGTIEEVPREVFERIVDTAIHGTANLARLVLPLFRSQGHGSLVIVNSLLGEIATPRMGAYDVGKWGQLGLARILQLETRDCSNVHVSVVSPGAINTPIYDQAANYAGRGGFPPPPVIAPERVAMAAIGCLDRPRRHVEVGPVNRLTVIGFRFLPMIFDRIVGPLVNRAVFRGPPSTANSGNAMTPVTGAEGEYGGWTWLGRRRRVGVDRPSE